MILTTTDELNMVAPSAAFQINSQNILWHKGEIRNLFVGVNAGANNIGGNAFQNTFIGNNAGFANITGQRNTFLGASAGESIKAGNWNTFIGTEAGKNLLTGEHNTFVGEQCGDKQINGDNNSFFGAHTGEGTALATGIGNNNTFLGAFSGADITNGDGNTFTGVQAGRNCDNGANNTFTGMNAGNQCGIGSRNTMSGSFSGFFTTTGNDNVFLGNRSGFFNKTGSNNTFIGNNTGPINSSAFFSLNNASAIGNSAQPRANNQMILGNNLVNVGIGLSNDVVQNGPQNKLEIEAGLNGFNQSAIGTIGLSGLRFRDLHSGNAVTPNGTNGVDNTKVLSVDANGDVILVDGGGCKTTLVSTSSLPVGAPQCLTGGVMLQYGIDANCNGVLDPSEINSSQTQYICNGANGAPGPAGGVVNANNGLSITSSSIAVLGQNVGQASNPAQLINDREIPLFGNDLIINMANSGNFIVGNSPVNNITSGSNSVFGNNNTFLTTNGTFGANFVSGDNNTIDHRSIKVFGSNNKLYGQGDFAIGNANLLNVNSAGNSNVAIGFNNQIDGTLNTVVGYDNRIINAPVSNNSPTTSYILGNRSFAYGGGSIVIGNKVVGIPSGDIVSIGNSNAFPTGPINSYFTANPGFSGVQNAHNDPVLSANDYIPAINIWANNRIGVKKYYPTVALDVAGTIATPVSVNVSDSTLKTNIQTLQIDALTKLKQFRPVTYEWINKVDTGMYGTQYGFTAQQIETVMPDFVKTGIDGIKTLNQSAMIPLLVKAIQQQQSKIDSLTSQLNSKDSIQDARLTALEEAINRCCSNNTTRTSNNSTHTALNQLDVELSDKDAVVLNQNVPNPFAEQTTITYNVPSNVGKAQLLFYNAEGKLIQTVDITTRGKGKINVFANDLSSGLYHYTLVVDGKVADSKKMVRE